MEMRPSSPPSGRHESSPARPGAGYAISRILIHGASPNLRYSLSSMLLANITALTVLESIRLEAVVVTSPFPAGLGFSSGLPGAMSYFKRRIEGASPNKGQR